MSKHKFDDECICVYCGHDGAEAHYYSKRGYAHEYVGSHVCHKAPKLEQETETK